MRLLIVSRKLVSSRIFLFLSRPRRDKTMIKSNRPLLNQILPIFFLINKIPKYKLIQTLKFIYFSKIYNGKRLQPDPFLHRGQSPLRVNLPQGLFRINSYSQPEKNQIHGGNQTKNHQVHRSQSLAFVLVKGEKSIRNLSLC